MRRQNKVERYRKSANFIVSTGSRRLEEHKGSFVVPFVGFILLVAVMSMLIFALMGCGHATIKVPATPVEDVLHNAGFEGDVKIAQMNADCNSQSAFVEKIVKYLLQMNYAEPTTIDVEARPGSSLCGDAQGTSNNVSLLTLGARNLGVFRVALRWRAITLRHHTRAQKLLWSMAPTLDKPTPTK